MVFEFNGDIFDTDKPIYVCGYTIIDTWFPISDECDIQRKVMEYKVSTKRCQVKSLIFDNTQNRKNGKMQNFISCVELDSFHANPYIPNIKLNEKYIYGKSYNECMKIFKNKFNT